MGFAGRVHAEAGLTALASACARATACMASQVGDMFMRQRGTLPVGLSSKCCWMCYRLALKLFILKDASPGVQIPPPVNANTTLHLPGTHGIITQWDPPAFGIPDDVLWSLLHELQIEAVDWAPTAASDDEHHQESPRSVVSEVPDDCDIAGGLFKRILRRQMLASLPASR
ncbi:hypothetical protein BV25DRAFT_1839135 [Artomyces pyxidatus]|uniref:Uncharacterized protein n=1 Tax=Artomyces pyxidatus TaxID=48021 RepID=A0ACB8SY66_9AGAM|nr:hypothetical protein BV25DRAFT_1839135 [Artomyces pyxidatus]